MCLANDDLVLKWNGEFYNLALLWSQFSTRFIRQYCYKNYVFQRTIFQLRHIKSFQMGFTCNRIIMIYELEQMFSKHLFQHIQVVSYLRTCGFLFLKPMIRFHITLKEYTGDWRVKHIEKNDNSAFTTLNFKPVYVIP